MLLRLIELAAVHGLWGGRFGSFLFEPLFNQHTETLDIQFIQSVETLTWTIFLLIIVNDVLT